MNYFIIDEDKASGYTGYTRGTHKWMLPGIASCPGCQATWSTGSKAYPSVNLTPVLSLGDFVEARAEPIEEYERLRALVRPLTPPEALLEPGTAFGPIVGRAQGRFGALAYPWTWWLFAQRDALDKLQAEGVRGLKGCPTQLRFRQRHPPELFELELVCVGRLHTDCLPPHRPPPCARCGREGLTLPKTRILDASTIPQHLDVFRLEDFSTLIVCTERFVNACQRLGLDGIAFDPLPLK